MRFHHLNVSTVKCKKRSDGMKVVYYYFNDNKNLLIISLVDGDGMIKTSKSWVLSNLVSREVRKSVNKCYRDWSNILMKTKNQELDIRLYC